ncbi:MAG: leucine--tRNA ligase [Ktedonobacterales bacterium]
MARSKYQPTEIEARWQARWAGQDAYAARNDDPRPKFYNLVMFPYPSGDLHIGHWYNYTGADIFGRFQRMNGYNVMQPIGFDAFGLPAENAAIKRNIQPREWTLDNIANMRKQLGKLGAAWDWDREVVTCLPDYYRWTQWVFLQFYKQGLAYRTKAPANWCPTCNTTLANEQVVSGACERCGTLVERREIDQWLLRITRYADELLNFEGLDWPEKTKLMQTNWIGRSEGAEVRFKAIVPPKTQTRDGGRRSSEDHAETIEISVFTTRPDTIYGVTFFLLAPEHPLVEKLTAPKQRNAVRAYIEQASHESEIERMSADKARPKTGVPLGSYALNPVSGERIPIWIADYVLMGYGTGAVMGVPAHDQRDFTFARAFGLPIRLVYQDETGSLDADAMSEAAPHVGHVINSGQFNGLPDSQATVNAFIQYIEEIGAGKATVNYRLRDWLVSRQRYWGAPIPIIYCPEHGEVAVPEDDLPVRLPDEAEFKPTGESPLRYDPSFLHTTCPICGKPATRETDTLDTFICSSWYFLRYADPHDETQAWAADKVAKWLPVDMYIGGAEHAVMHLLYARFFVKALRDMGLLAFEEPFTRLYHQGTVLGPDGQKMSKSRGNVIAPDSVVSRYGADAVRAYLMFMGPFDQGGPWNNQGIEGVSRYLNRVWALYSDYLDEQSSGAQVEVAAGVGVKRLRHRTIARVTEDYRNLRFNTALAALMEFVNGLNKARDDDKAVTNDPRFTAALETLALLLAPMAPFIGEEMWHGLAHADSVHAQSWPGYDPALTVDERVTVVVQVNGKLRDKLEAAPGISEDEARELALASAKVQAALAGRPVRKVIYVPGKLLNVVG